MKQSIYACQSGDGRGKVFHYEKEYCLCEKSVSGYYDFYLRKDYNWVSHGSVKATSFGTAIVNFINDDKFSVTVI